jgi:hypothetical protein
MVLPQVAIDLTCVLDLRKFGLSTDVDGPPDQAYVEFFHPNLDEDKDLRNREVDDPPDLSEVESYIYQCFGAKNISFDYGSAERKSEFRHRLRIVV